MKFFTPRSVQSLAATPVEGGIKTDLCVKKFADSVSSFRFLIAAFSILLSAFAAMAQMTNDLSDAQIWGRQLAQQILEETPARNLKQTGILRIEDSKWMIINTPVTFTTVVTNGYWKSEYLAEPTNNYGAFISLTIIHKSGLPNQYIFCEDKGNRVEGPIERLTLELRLNKNQIMVPFANSDYWIADLGLEFFHWPEQKILKHESRRGRDCAVLESRNPNQSPGGYSHVVSWIDDETLGIVHADAYDANGKLLKEFDPKSFKKVNGQWELQDMEIRNVQTGSRTRVKFNLR